MVETLGMDKIGRAYKGKTKDELRYEFGVVDKFNQSTAFCSVSGWLSFINRDYDEAQVRRFKALFRSFICNASKEIFGAEIDYNRTIRDYLLADKYLVMKNTPKSIFFKVELTLFFHGVISITSKEYNQKFEALVASISEFMVEFDGFYIIPEKIK